MAGGTMKELSVNTTTCATLQSKAGEKTGGASYAAHAAETGSETAPGRTARPRQRVKIDLGPSSLVAGVTDDFSELPRDAGGRRVAVAYDGETYSRYIEWLADYLYRPAVFAPETGTLHIGGAWPPVSSIAGAIALYLWQHPSEEYPPLRYGGIPRPIHADFIHRAELSKILSRVPRRQDRRELLNRFYSQLTEDLQKNP